MVENMHFLENKIIRINERDKSVDIGENVENENYECKTSSNESVESIIRTDKSIIKETEGHLIYCDMCSYKCKHKKTMVKHLNSKHENFQQCDLCGTKFINEDTLKCHVKIEHETEHETEHDTDQLGGQCS